MLGKSGIWVHVAEGANFSLIWVNGSVTGLFHCCRAFGNNVSIMKYLQFLFVLYLPSLSSLDAGWTSTGFMSYPVRIGHTTTLLKDGRVLVVGGRTDINNYSALENVEIYDPNTSLWASAPSMSQKRIGHTATLLEDGRVLIVGGTYNNSNGTASVDLFDPVTEQWQANPPIKQGRSGHAAQMLPNGKIIIFGGSSLYNHTFKTELYDPPSGVSIYVSDCPDDKAVKTILLPTGMVLSTGISITTSLFDPNFYSWTSFQDPTLLGYSGDLVSLIDQRVLKAGGFSGERGTIATTMIYQPNTNQWTASGNLNTARYEHQTTALKNGKVLVTGGMYSSNLSTTEIFNPQTGIWSYGEQMTFARSGHKATMLNDGRILVAGGSNNPPEIYSYAPEVISHPSSQNKLQNKSVVLSVTAGGGGNQIYQWKREGINILNATLATLTITSVQLSDAGSYTVTVTNSEGSVVSNTAILTVIPDSDGDGLSDADETNIYHTDPNKADTDGDGLNDYDEIFVHLTNPLNQDTDGDGFLDSYEVLTGKSPLDSLDKPSLVAEARTAIEFSFPSASGKTYRIEGSPNLVTWSTLEDRISGTGAGITRFYSTRDTPVRFFRIEESVNP